MLLPSNRACQKLLDEIAIAACVDLLGIQNISQTTNMTNQRNTMNLLITLPSVKIKTKSHFSRP